MDLMLEPAAGLHPVLKVKGVYSSSLTDLRATGRHLPYEITQYYLPPNTSECGVLRLNPSQTDWYSIYLPRRDGGLR